MKGKYLKGKTIEYDGSQLSPLWAYTSFDVQGDSIVSFRGPCNIAEEFMVDIEDKRKNLEISSPDMLHFIVEYFGVGIDTIVLVQRLLISTAVDLLRESVYEEADVEREFDNIYAFAPEEDERGKLSVSVATVSVVSGLIHLGLNITSEGTPVKAAGLEEIGVEDFDKFAVELARRFIEEIKNTKMDASKVRPVT
ncbi:MAG TPA: DUF366 family protein [Candidatus Anoxymicrobiaceae bacterium]